MKHSHLLLLAFLLLRTAFGEPNQARVHVVVAVSGQVEVKHGEAGQYQHVAFGAQLSDLDLIHLGDGARVQIVCADLTMAPELVERYSGVPCRKDTPVILNRGGVFFGPVRSSGQPSGFPMILGPRATRILNPAPTIAWTAVAGTTAYRVSILNTNWSTEVRGAIRVQYPKTAPALVPNKDYRVTVVVTAPASLAGLSSEAESQADLGFTVLPETQAKTVSDAKARIGAFNTSSLAKRFLTALIYSDNKLRYEAIGMLHSLWSELPEFAVAEELADLYRATGIDTEAAKWYAEASKMAPNDEDRARAFEGLAMASISDRAKAAEAAQQALLSFRKVGNEESVKRMERLLKIVGR